MPMPLTILLAIAGPVGTGRGSDVAPGYSFVSIVTWGRAHILPAGPPVISFLTVVRAC